MQRKALSNLTKGGMMKLRMLFEVFKLPPKPPTKKEVEEQQKESRRKAMERTLMQDHCH